MSDKFNKLDVFIKHIAYKYSIQPNDLLELEDLIQDEHIFLIDEIKNLENLNEK
jgi:hypothetical protein